MDLLKLCCALAMLSIAAAAHDLSAAYPFRTTLFNAGDDQYELYWKFDLAVKNIQFAVRVNTTGWVGFGLSPNGGMPNSDVVIGWVDSSTGQGYLDDRFADAEAHPPVDTQQDWELVNAEEEGGQTTLEFKRDFVTCDPRDRDVEFNTARIIFSWNDNDPAGNSRDLVMQHSTRGTKSVNLLTVGASSASLPAGAESFTVKVNNVEIPAVSTTYWCAAARLPEEVRNETKYIFEIVPRITNHMNEYVHHILIYLCNAGLSVNDVNDSGNCFVGDVGQSLDDCAQSELIGGWAVGGSELSFPNGVALPIGGPGTPEYMLVEMHYDNPNSTSGIIDNSGFEYYYTSTPPVNLAGILWLGNVVHDRMIIPPKGLNYGVDSFCPSQCTKAFIPENGINVFASLLHTHLIGTGVSSKVIRNTKRSNSTATCNLNEELAPTDENLQYDFNFQQANKLPNEVTIYPGDAIVVECDYDSSKRTTLTHGGLSTQEEMCLNFLIYYPRIELRTCTAGLSDAALTDILTKFVTNYVPSDQQSQFVDLQSPFDEAYVQLNTLQWTPSQLEAFEELVSNSTLRVNCINLSPNPTPGRESQSFSAARPTVDCEYQAPDTCTNFVPTPCCERGLERGTEGATATAQTNLLLVATTTLTAAMASITWM